MMGTKLRHIKGPDINELQRQLMKIKLPHVVKDILHVKGNWYIFFLLQGHGEVLESGEFESLEKAEQIKIK